LRLNWAVLTSGNSKSRTEIDVKSIVDYASHRRSATSLGDTRHLLVGHTERGSTLEAWLDLARSVPYARLRARSDDSTVFELERLAVNEPVPAAAFRFPRFEETLGLKPTVVTLDKLGELVQRVPVSMATRMGLRSAEMRAKLDAQFSQPLDWERLRARDAAVVPVLKALVAEYEQLP
jgi:hypothetical protein